VPVALLDKNGKVITVFRGPSVDNIVSQRSPFKIILSSTYNVMKAFGGENV
jgi:hypothetical protein